MERKLDWLADLIIVSLGIISFVLGFLYSAQNVFATLFLFSVGLALVFSEIVIVLIKIKIKPDVEKLVRAFSYVDHPSFDHELTRWTRGREIEWLNMRLSRSSEDKGFKIISPIISYEVGKHIRENLRPGDEVISLVHPEQHRNILEKRTLYDDLASDKDLIHRRVRYTRILAINTNSMGKEELKRYWKVFKDNGIPVSIFRQERLSGDLLRNILFVVSNGKPAIALAGSFVLEHYPRPYIARIYFGEGARSLYRNLERLKSVAAFGPMGARER